MEILLGTQEQKEKTKRKLDFFRKNPLSSIEPAIDGEVVTASNWLSSTQLNNIFDLYHSFSSQIPDSLASYWPSLDLDRTYIYNNDIEEIGGFYSPKSLGYLHIQDISIFSGCNPDIQETGQLLDFARAALHDALHRATFRSYICTHQRFPHRYQYGLNYRDEAGNTFTKTGIRDWDNRLINLNILMEGTIDIVVSDFLTPKIRDLCNECDKTNRIIQDIAHEVPDNYINDRQKYYYRSVLGPSREFIQHWKTDTWKHIIGPMLSGELSELDSHLIEESGGDISLDGSFKSAKFSYANL